MNLKPLGNRVLVELKKKETATPSGIVLPEASEKERKAEGVVVSVGEGKLLENGNRIKVPVSVGDMVVVKSWGGDEVKLDGKEYKIFDAEDILAIIE